ncbi:tannase and feruloyl esterase [Penicillium canescens]|nr:tannase and feruloyl esterase [Penicillium canescens]
MNAAIKINPGGVNSGETDLSTFHRRGGKIISYQGWNDETLTSMLSMQLFLIPGLHHCHGSPVAWSIGQYYSPLDSSKLDPSNSMILALVDRVEHGTAPVSLAGKKYQNDVIGGPIEAQRTGNASLLEADSQEVHYI